MAKWRGKKWVVSSKKIASIENLSFAYQKKSDNDAMEAFSLSFSTTLHSGAGVNVRAEIESWSKLVTKTDYFYLGGKKLGPKLQLHSVSVTDATIDDFGRMRLATLDFTLKEKEKATPAADGTSAVNVGAQTSDKAEKKPSNSQVSNAPIRLM